MNLRDLMDVKAICEAGSFRKAAALRGVTQPTLSQRVAHLEDQLGVRLFDRSRGGSEPTDLALHIANRSEGIAQEAAIVAQEISRLAAGKSGTMRLGLGPGPMRSLAQPIVEEVGCQLPELAIEIQSASTLRLGEWLLRREIDAALCPPIESADARIKTLLQLDAPVVIAANPRHALFASPPPSIRELLLSYPVALPPTETRYRQLVQAHFGIELDALPGHLVCSDYELLIRIVAEGTRYFTAGPAFAFNAEVATGRLKVLSIPVPFPHFVAMQINRDALPLPAVRQALDIITGLLPRLRSTG